MFDNNLTGQIYRRRTSFANIRAKKNRQRVCRVPVKLSNFEQKTIQGRTPVGDCTAKVSGSVDMCNGVHEKHERGPDQNDFEQPKQQQPKQPVPPNERREKRQANNRDVNIENREQCRVQFQPEPPVQIQRRKPDDRRKNDEPFGSTRPRPKPDVLQFVQPVNELFNFQAERKFKRQNGEHDSRRCFRNVFPAFADRVRNAEFVEHEKRNVPHEVHARILKNAFLRSVCCRPFF